MMCVRDIPELVSQGFMSVFKLIHIGCASYLASLEVYNIYVQRSFLVDGQLLVHIRAIRYRVKDVDEECRIDYRYEL